MKLARPPPRQPAETIIALIDVIFFLLVFFMLVGRMDATAPFEVTPPVSGMGAPMPRGGATVSVAADGRLALDGEATGRAALIEALDARAPERIRVQAHATARLRTVLPLVADLEGLGTGKVVLVVTPPEAP